MKKKFLILTALLLVLSACGREGVKESSELDSLREALVSPIKIYEENKHLLDMNSDLIAEGISIYGIGVSNLSKEEAKKKITDKVNEDLSRKHLTIKSGEKTADYTLDKIGLTSDLDKVVAEAFNYTRTEDKAKRDKIDKELEHGKDFDLTISFDLKDKKAFYKDLEKKLNIVKKDDKISFSNGRLQVKKGKDGWIIDEEETMKALDTIINKLSSSEKIELTLSKHKDKSSVYDIGKINESIGNIGSSSTDFSYSPDGRKTNIRISAKKIDNYIIMPGETFSFLANVGSLGPDDGYVEAGVIADGEFTSGFGGGVCQVSTTAYQAAVKAGLKIVERNNHTRPITYSPKGTDAMVSSSWSDLKFKNNYDFPVVIKTDASGGNIKITILGDTSVKNYNLSIRAETTKEIRRPYLRRLNTNLEPGSERVIQEGNEGYKAVMYLVNEKTGKSTFMHEDYYPERAMIVEYNPALVREEKTEEGKDKSEEGKEKTPSKGNSEGKKESDKKN